MGIRSIGTVGLAAVMAGTLGVVLASPAQAAPDSVAVTTADDVWSEAEAFADAVRKLEPSIIRAKDGTLAFTTTAAGAGIAQETFDQVAASLEVTNQGVRAGELETTVDLQVRPAGNGVQHNGIVVHWWGHELHLDAYWTQRLEGLLTAGGVGSNIANLIRAATLATLSVALQWAGVIAGIGLVAVLLCKNSGGVRFYRPHVGPPWCTGH